MHRNAHGAPLGMEQRELRVAHLPCKLVGKSAGVSPLVLYHIWSPRTSGQPANTRQRTGLVTFSSLHAAREVSSACWVLAGVFPFPVACCQQTRHMDINEAVETEKEETKCGEWIPRLRAVLVLLSASAVNSGSALL